MLSDSFDVDFRLDLPNNPDGYVAAVVDGNLGLGRPSGPELARELRSAGWQGQLVFFSGVDLTAAARELNGTYFPKSQMLDLIRHLQAIAEEVNA